MNDYDIGKIYREMELHLIRSMRKNLGRHLTDEIAEGMEWKMWQSEKLKELKRYQRQNKDIINAYTSGLDKDIADILKEEFKQGHKSEINKYNKLFDKKVSDSFFKLNDRKANALIKVVNEDLNKANTAALRMMNDTYRQTIHKAATFASNGVMTQKQAVDMATRDFLSRGLNVIEYADGKRVNIASYSQMAVRTASQRAMLMGEGEFRKSIGETLVIISKHGTACKLCQPHESQVYIDDVYSGGKPDGKHKLLSEAMDQGLFHPNCRHGVSTYYGLDDEEETTVNVPKDNNNEEKTYIDRQIQKADRKIEGFQDKENILNAKLDRSKWVSRRDKLRTTPKTPTNVLGNEVDYSTLKLESEQTRKLKEDLTNLTAEYNTRLSSVTFHSRKEIKANGDVDLSGNMRLSMIQRTTYYHEFAHTLTQTNLVKYNLGNETDTLFWNDAKKLFKDYKKEIRTLQRDNPLKVYDIRISNYSLDNVDEFVAEGFARAKLDGTDAVARDGAYNNKILSPYATKILDLIDKYYKKR